MKFSFEIRKTHLIYLLILLILFLSVIAYAQVKQTHTIDEIDFSQPILNDINLQGALNTPMGNLVPPCKGKWRETEYNRWVWDCSEIVIDDPINYICEDDDGNNPFVKGEGGSIYRILPNEEQEIVEYGSSDYCKYDDSAIIEVYCETPNSDSFANEEIPCQFGCGLDACYPDTVSASKVTDFPNDLGELVSNEEKVFDMKVKNLENKKTCFYLEFVCDENGGSCPIGSTFTELSDNHLFAFKNGWNWFVSLNPYWLDPFDTWVHRFWAKPQNTPANSYNGKLLIWKHYIGAVDNPYELQYTECLDEKIGEWPSIKMNVPAIASGLPPGGHLQAGNEIFPAIISWTPSWEPRTVKLHDEIDFTFDVIN
tara:strand:+ start:3994 stop:5097 length:1104 start_codon:yes stop_codon:yes gene_type:complete